MYNLCHKLAVFNLALAKGRRYSWTDGK